MISADKERLFPRFLLDDVTGNAMAAAVTRGLEYFCQVLDDGIGQLTDPDRMSEKRLDELAGEYGIYYDYSADIALKRKLIKNAYLDYAAYGTLWAVKNFGSIYLKDVEVIESSDGLDHRFWVFASDADDAEAVRKARAAIEATKNVRSELMDIRKLLKSGISVTAS